MKKVKSKKKIILIILLCLVLLLVIGWAILSVSIYNENFNKRFSSYEPLMLHVEDFDGLQCEPCEFTSDKGQKLAGYLYSADSDPRGIIVIAHGLGAGQNSYMDCADYFAHHGYYVFAYDATGNDKSEGDGVGAIPQGVADLDHAVSYAESRFPELPVALFGHSWGGYSACAVLNFHPEVRAVVECCGCNRSSDLFEAGGLDQAGSVIYTMMPFIRLHERIHCGKYAAATAMDGFAASDAAVMVVHSADDGVVPIRYGYDLYYEKYKNDPRFVFQRFENRGHNFIFSQTGYLREFYADMNRWAETLDYDIYDAANAERFQNEKAAFIRNHLDREKLTHDLDPELFDGFLAFYDEHIR